MPQDRSHRPDQTGSLPVGAALPDKGGTYFLGRYRVVDEIGIGGMATVHLARMDGLGGFQKWVAIKKIHAHLLEDESFVQMFLDEARIVARIQHANVCSVFELGRHEDCYWIAMEYLHGEPLRELMRRNEELGTPMPPEIACRVVADAAEGLHAAHELVGKNGEKLQLVHRDVTPHNLFVTYDGTTKVVDFGIAKFASRVSNTRAGTLKGKLAYMSPEQVHGEPIDRRTDLFALGVVLWELTTGQRLFRMDSDLDTLAKVQECNVPRPSTLVRGYPLDLEKIVMKVLARNRNERFKTARELSRALQSFLMRRGLFVASDEVATYVQSVFAERIQKREAHLRWAAEVTQTINIDALRLEDSGLPLAGLPHAQPEQQQPHEPKAMPARLPAPRPAAGMPPRPAPRTMETPSLATPATGLRPYDDGPTLQGELPDFGYEGGDDFDDNDDTLVAQGRADSHETAAVFPNPPLPGAAPQKALPVPAAGRPADPFQGLPLQGPPLPGSPLQNSRLGPNAPAPQGSAFPTVPLQSAFPGDFAHAPTVPAQPNPFMPDPSMSGAGPRWQTSMVPGDTAQGQMLVGGAAPMAVPDRENRTITAKGLKQGIPMWVVASIAGILALVLVGAIYMVFLGRAPGARPPVAAAAGSSAGPFGSARAAFDTAIAPKAPSALPADATLEFPTPPTAAPSAAPATSASSPALAPSAASSATTSANTAAPVAKAAQKPEPKPEPKHDGPVELPPPKKLDKTGLLTVICKPACDEATDNGRPFDASVPRQSVTAGEHRLVLKTSNPPVTKTQTVTVSPGDLTIQRVMMSP